MCLLLSKVIINTSIPVELILSQVAEHFAMLISMGSTLIAKSPDDLFLVKPVKTRPVYFRARFTLLVSPVKRVTQWQWQRWQQNMNNRFLTCLTHFKTRNNRRCHLQTCMSIFMNLIFLCHMFECVS